MPNPLRVAVIYGSTRDGRLCDRIVRWVVEGIEAQRDYVLDVIDPAGRHDGDGPIGTRAMKRRLERADAFVVVTPEYNHSYPAPLKALIDSAYDEWNAKPVGFVSYGGASGGLRAVEHLRGVFAEVHAVGLRDGVMFPNVWHHVDDDGVFRASESAGRALITMLAGLDWWAHALRQARSSSRYAEALA